MRYDMNENDDCSFEICSLEIKCLSRDTPLDQK